MGGASTTLLWANQEKNIFLWPEEEASISIHRATWQLDVAPGFWNSFYHLKLPIQCLKRASATWERNTEKPAGKVRPKKMPRIDWCLEDLDSVFKICFQREFSAMTLLHVLLMERSKQHQSHYTQLSNNWAFILVLKSKFQILPLLSFRKSHGQARWDGTRSL